MKIHLAQIQGVGNKITWEGSKGTKWQKWCLFTRNHNPVEKINWIFSLRSTDTTYWVVLELGDMICMTWC